MGDGSQNQVVRFAHVLDKSAIFRSRFDESDLGDGQLSSGPNAPVPREKKSQSALDYIHTNIYMCLNTHLLTLWRMGLKWNEEDRVDCIIFPCQARSRKVSILGRGTLPPLGFTRAHMSNIDNLLLLVPFGQLSVPAMIMVMIIHPPIQQSTHTII